MATLVGLRHKLIADWGITTAADTMLVDLVMLSYAHALRVQGWIGDLAVRIEHEFFGDDAFTELVNERRRVADRFAVAERLRQLSEQLIPPWVPTIASMQILVPDGLTRIFVLRGERTRP